MTLRTCLTVLLAATAIGCTTDVEPASVEAAPVDTAVAATMKVAPAKAKAKAKTKTKTKTKTKKPGPSTHLKAKKKPAKPGGKKIATRPKPPQYKWGCNYNTSCKANCEWCGINGTCTCRFKGIP